ncbi:MAG: hypothetical protein OHK0031_10840 [Anaerolineales bacterium]
MFDDLRKDSDSSAYFQDARPEEKKEEAPAVKIRATPRRAKKSALRLPRLTPAQRLILALLLLAMTCVSGPLLLLLTGKIVPF